MTVTKYLTIFAVLLVLSGLTFGLSFLSLGAWEWPMALGIAAVKGTLVAMYFMHLIELSSSHRLAGVVAVVLLGILVLFAMADVWTRPQQVGSACPNAHVCWGVYALS